MNPIVVAIACVVLAFLSTKLLKHFSSAVPVVLIGLPVILSGLAVITVVSLAQAFALSASGIPALALVSALAAFVGGGFLAKSYFNSAMKN